MKLKLFGSIFLLSFLLTIIVFPNSAMILLPSALSYKLPQLVTVFISIVIQAIPFVLIAVFGSALMQTLITVEMVEEKLSHTKRLPGILLAIAAGFFFPVCDCGVIPVVRRLLVKKVPPYMAMAFLVTAPLINPITVWATATAFNYNMSVTLLRVGMAIAVGIIVALVVGKFFPTSREVFRSKIVAEMETGAGQLCSCHTADQHSHSSKLAGVFNHANEEFLEVGQFLIFGSLLAATIQTYVPKQALMVFTDNPFLSVLVMMILAVALSLCAEADAFVARSFTFHFPLSSVMAFMVFGQMVDIKNAALLLKSFKPQVVLLVVGLCAVSVFLFCVVLGFLPVNDLILGRY